MLLQDAIFIVARLDYLTVKAALEAHGIRTDSDRTAKMRTLLAEKIAAGEISDFGETIFFMVTLNVEKFFGKEINPDQQKRLAEIREAAKHLAQCIQDLTPSSAEQTLAIRSVISAVHHSGDAMLVNE